MLMTVNVDIFVKRVFWGVCLLLRAVKVEIENEDSEGKEMQQRS